MREILDKVEILVLELLGFIRNCGVSSGGVSRSSVERGELTDISIKI
jgi:hypothetical protein